MKTSLSARFSTEVKKDMAPPPSRVEELEDPKPAQIKKVEPDPEITKQFQALLKENGIENDSMLKTTMEAQGELTKLYVE